MPFHSFHFIKLYAIASVCILCFALACKNSNAPSVKLSTHGVDMEGKKIKDSEPNYDHNDWSRIDTSDGIALEIRYATKNNFTKTVIYECPSCYLRPAVAVALKKVNATLLTKGYRLKLFDCYRPTPAQQKLWNIVPDSNYVTPPKKGSMHSKGLAVDLTLTYLNGKEVDMGTPYDFFGKEAHSAYANLPAEILERRALLRNTMKAFGFKSIRTEWWHYSFEHTPYGLSSWKWPCN